VTCWKKVLFVILVSFLLEPRVAVPDTDVVVVDEDSPAPPVLEKSLEGEQFHVIEENVLAVEEDSSPGGESDFKGIIIGKNLKPGTPLVRAIEMLGNPKSIKVTRGSDPKLDSISMEYPGHGVIIHVMNNRKSIEALEVLPQFKGRFQKGIKVGAKASVLIKKLGAPQSMDSSIARYPREGIYFILKENVLTSAHVFSYDSQISHFHRYRKP